MRKCLRSMPFALLLCTTLPRPAHAQIGFESLLGGVNNVSFFFSCWKARGGVQARHDCPSEKNGYGIEVSYLVAKLPVKGGNMREIPARMQLTGVSVVCSRNGCDTTKTFAPIPAKKVPVKYVGLELALGYSQFSGFGSTDPTLELRGAVREIPAVAIYGNFVDEDARGLLKYIEPYVGVTSGLIQLNNVSLLDHAKADTLVAYSAGGTAFQLGGAAGMSVALGDRMSFFSEISYQIRRFPGIQWGSVGTTKIRNNFPETLDFTGRAFSVGLEFAIRSPGA